MSQFDMRNSPGGAKTSPGEQPYLPTISPQHTGSAKHKIEQPDSMGSMNPAIANRYSSSNNLGPIPNIGPGSNHTPNIQASPMSHQ